MRVAAILAAVSLSTGSVPAVASLIGADGGGLEAEMLVAASAPAATGAGVTLADLDAAVVSAIADWRGIVGDTALAAVTVVVADLPAGQLGRASGDRIEIDVDAAGHGWGGDGMDLATAIRHELGHALGLGHSDDGLMRAALAPREQHDVPSLAALALIPPGAGVQALEESTETDATSTDAPSVETTSTDTTSTDTTATDTTATDATAADTTAATDPTAADTTATDTTAATDPTSSTTDDEIAADADSVETGDTDNAGDAACETVTDPSDTTATPCPTGAEDAEDPAADGAAEDPAPDGAEATAWNVDGGTAVFQAGGTIDATLRYDAGTNELMVVHADGTVDAVSLDGVTSVMISGSDGDDSIVIDLVGLPDGVVVAVDGGDGTDTIGGPSTDTTWTISGAGTGSVDGVTFSGAENLAGASGNEDTFVFESGGSIIGMLTGGDGGFDTVEVAGGGFDSLRFTTTAPDAGSIDRDGQVIAYSGFEPIVVDATAPTSVTIDVTSDIATPDEIVIEDIDGDPSNGTFQIRFNNAETHVINGAGSISSLIINAGVGDDTITFASIDSLFTGVITVNGGGGDDTFVGPDIGATWTISGVNSGTWSPAVPPPPDPPPSWPAVSFSEVENLTGGATAADGFQFESGGAITGVINDGAGTLTVSVAGFVRASGAFDFVRMTDVTVDVDTTSGSPTPTSLTVQTVSGSTATGFLGVSPLGFDVGFTGTLGDFAVAIFTDGTQSWQVFEGTLNDATFTAGDDIALETPADVTIGVNDAAGDGSWLHFSTPVVIGPVTFDFTGGPVTQATADVSLTIEEYVHLSGTLTIERGQRFLADIATGLPSNIIQIADDIGLAADVLAILNTLPLAASLTGLGLDPVADMYLSDDYSMIHNVPVAAMTLAFTDAAVFVGHFPSWVDTGDGLGGGPDGQIQEDELGEDAIGLFANDVDVVVLKVKPQLTAYKPLNTLINRYLPSFTAVQASIGSVDFVGVDELTLELTGITINVNNGKPWPGDLGPPVVDYTATFETSPGERDGALDLLIGGDTYTFAFDGNQRIGVRAESVILTIDEFVHVSGSFAFEMGPVRKINVATYLSQHEVAALDALFGDITPYRLGENDDPPELGGDLAIAHDLSMIYNVEVATTQIGIGGANVFVGYIPDWVDTGDGSGGAPNGQIDEDELVDAVGLFAGGIDLGYVKMTPTASALFSSLPSFWALKAHADLVTLVGVPGVALSVGGFDFAINTGDAWPGDLGPPVVDWESSFPEVEDDPSTLDLDETAPAGMPIDTGGLGDPVLMDLLGVDFIGVYAEDVVLSLGGFVHVSGSFAIEKGDGATVTVATGFPDNLGDELAALSLQEDIDAFWTALGFDPDNLPSFSLDLSTVENVEVAFLTIGAADIDIFVGFDPALLTHTGGEYAPGADAIGVWIEDAEIAVVIATPTLEALIDALPTFYAFKAHADSLELLGVEDASGTNIVTVSATGIDVWVNNATSGWGPGGAWTPVIDWLTSFPAIGEDPAGLAIAGSSLLIDFDGNQRMGGSIEEAVLAIGGIVHVAGSVFFEQGPVQKVHVATYLSQHEVLLAEASLSAVFGPSWADLRLGESDPIPTDLLRISHDLSTIYNVEVSVLRLGIGDASAFVGYNAGFTFGESGTEISPDAIGVLATGVDVGFVLMSPTLATLPGLSSIPNLWALKVQIDTLSIMNLPGVTLEITDATIKLNQGGLWPGQRGPPVVDWETTFGEDGYAVPTGDGGEVLMDLPAVQFFGLYVEHALLSLAGFIHVSGSFGLENGDGDVVTVATGFPDNLGDLLAGVLPVGDVLVETLKWLGFDEENLPTLSADFSTITNLEVAYLTIGAANVNIFVGYNPGWQAVEGQTLDRDDLGDDAIGLYIGGGELSFVWASPTLSGDVDGLPEFYALKAHADLVELVGMDAEDDLGNTYDIVTVTAEGVDVWVNNATKGWGPGGAWTPVIDWATTYPAVPEDLGEEGPEDDIAGVPAGLEIAGSSLLIDFDGNQRIGGHADQVLITVGGFLYVTGEIFFEMGPVTKVHVATFLAQHEVALVDALLTGTGLDAITQWTEEDLPTDGLLYLSDDVAYLYNVEVSVLQLGITNATAFLGYNPGWGEWGSNPALTIDDLGDDAIGLFLGGVDIGFVQMAPTLATLPGFADVLPSFWAMSAHADTIDLVGFEVDGVDLLELHAEDVTIQVNTGSPWPGGFGPPIVDWELTYPGVGSLGDLDYVAPGFLIGGNVLDEPIAIDLPGLDLIRVQVGGAVLSILQFVHVSGSFSFESGDAANVTVATGIPDNLGETIGDILDGLGLGGVGTTESETLPYFSTDFSTVFNVEVSFLKVGASDVDIFVGYNPGTAPFDDAEDLSDNAVGLLIADAEIAFVMATPTLQSLISALPDFYALKAHAESVQLVGIDDGEGNQIVTLSATGVDVWVNNSNKGWGPGGAWNAVVDWAASFPADEGDPGPEDDIPAGIEIATGPSSSAFIDFDGNQRIGGSAEEILLQIHDFIHVSGSLFFEMGPVMKVQVATGANTLNRTIYSTLLGGLGLTLDADEDPPEIGGDLAIANDFSYVYNLEVSVLQLGISGATVFVGYNPDMAVDDDGDLVISDDAVGLLVEGLDLGFVMMTPTLSTLPGLSTLPRLYAFKASADTIALLGIPEVEISGSGVRVEVNYGAKWGATSPVVDWEMSFPGVEDDENTTEDESVPVGFLVNTGNPLRPIYIDFDGNTLIGGGAENVHIDLGGFVYIDGAIYFEMGPVFTAQLADALLPVEQVADLLGLDALNPLVGITETEVSLLAIGGYQLDAFVGVGGPYWTDDNNDHIKTTDELNEDAIGVSLTGLTFGLAVMTPTAAGDPRRYIALSADADELALVGLDDPSLPGGGLTVSAQGIHVDLNITTPFASVFPILPVIDFAKTFETSEGANDGFLAVKTGARDEFGNDITVDLDFDGLLIRVQVDFVALNIFGVLSVYGGLLFELGPQKDVVLADGFTTKTVTTMTIAAQSLNGFIGWNGPYVSDVNLDGHIGPEDFDVDGAPLATNSSAIGIAITDLDIALFVGLAVELEPGEADLGAYIAGDVSLQEFAFVGVAGFALYGTLGLQFNLGIGTTGGLNPIDFAASFPQIGTVGDEDYKPAGYQIEIGAPNPLLLNFDDFLFKLELAGAIELENVFAAVGTFFLELDSSSFKMLVTAQIVIGPDLAGFDASANGGQGSVGTPMFAISALGALVINAQGIALDIDVDIEVDVPGLDLTVAARILINTTGLDQQIEIPDRLYTFLTEASSGTGITADLADDLIARLDTCSGSGADRCYTIDAGAPNILVSSTLYNLLNNPTGAIVRLADGPYVVVAIYGELDFLGFATGQGVAGVGISGTAPNLTFQFVFDVEFSIGTAGIELEFQADGAIEISPAGLLIDVHVEIDADITSLFHLDMSGDLEIDTRTGISGNPYFRLALSGRLDVAGIVSVSGAVEIRVGGPAATFSFAYPGGTDTVHYLGGTGAWRFSVTNLTGDFGPIRITLNGFIQSDGQFGINATGSIRLGVDGFNISGSISAGASLIIVDRDGDGIFGEHNEYQLRLYISGSANLEVFGIDLAGVDITAMVHGFLGESVTVTVRACVSLLFWDACGSVDVFSIRLPSSIIPEGPPDLAQFAPGGSSVLELNVGDNADRRRANLQGITAESYRLTELSNGDVKVELLNSLGQAQAWEVFSGVTSITGDFGGDNDRFVMLAGTDIPVNIGGGAGNDLLTYLGTGTATLSGGDGNDTLTGGDGADTLLGGPGNDYLDGRGGVDTVNGGTGDDILFGLITNLFGATSETLNGGEGNDIVEILGTLGNDSFSVDTVAGTPTRLRVSYTGTPSGSALIEAAETVLLNPRTGADSITLSGNLGASGLTDLKIIMGEVVQGETGPPTPDSIDSITMVLLGGDDVITLTGAQAAAILSNVRGDGVVNDFQFTGSPTNVSQTVADWSGRYRLTLNNSGPTNVDLLTIQSGAGADNFLVQSIEANVRLEGGDGDDRFALGSAATTTTNTGGTLEGIRAALTIVGGAPTASDVLVVDDTGDADGETGRLTSTTITGWGLGAGGVTYSEVETISVNLGTGNDTAEVWSTAGGAVTTINAGNGNDIFRVSSNAPSAGSLNFINGSLTINGGDGSDSAFLSDRNDTLEGSPSDTGTLAATTLTGYSPATITYGTIETLELDLGTGANNLTIVSPGATTVNVDSGSSDDEVIITSISAGTTVTVNGEATADRITVNGNAGTLIINGNDGDDVITINANAITGTITVNGGNGADFVQINAMGGTATVNGDAGDDDVVVRGLQGSLTVNGGADHDWVGVLATTAGSTLVVNGGAGNDVFEVGSNAEVGSTSLSRRALDEGGSLDAVDGAVTINGDTPSASDWLYVDDTGDDTGEAGLLTSTTITGLGMAVGITYGTVEHLEISLGASSTVFNVASTNAGTDTILETGAGDDTINVSSTLTLASLTPDGFGTVDLIAGHLTIRGQSGTDTANVDDRNDDIANEGWLTGTDLTGLGMGSLGITYAGLELLNIDLGSGDDRFHILSTHTTQTDLDTWGGADEVNVQTIAGHTVVDTGVADDVINVGSLAPGVGGTVNGIAALLEIAGGTGADDLNVDDTGDGFQNAGVVTSMSVEGFGMTIDGGHDPSDAFHVITITNAFDGTFTITIGTVESEALDFDASVAAVRDALIAALGVSAADLDITRTLNGQQLVYTIGFTGALAGDTGRDLGTIAVDGTALIGIAENGTVASSASSMTDGRLTYGGIEEIVVGLGGGDDAVHVRSTSVGSSTTLNAGAGRDTLLIETIAGTTVINGELGADSLVLNPLPCKPTCANGIDANALTFDGGIGSDHYVLNVFSTGDSEIRVHDSAVGDVTGFDRLTINGTSGPDQFLMRAVLEADGDRFGLVALLGGFDEEIGETGAFTTAERIIYDNTIDAGVTVNGLGGDDHFALDDNSSVMTINGGAGADTFQVGQLFGDENHFDADWPVTLLEVTRGQLSNGVSFSTTINGGDGPDLFFVFHNIAPLQLNGDGGDDEFVVRTFLHRDEETRISAGGGRDLIQYVSNSPVAIDGGDGFDTVVVIGTEADDVFVVTATGVYGAGRFVSFVGVERVDVDGAEGNDTFNVLSTAPGVEVRVFGGLGSDTVNVGADAEAVFADDLLGHTGLIAHEVESTDGTWDGTHVDGIAAEIADDDEAVIVVTDTGGTTIVCEGGRICTSDSYSIVLTQAPDDDVYITISAPSRSPDAERDRSYSVQLSTDGGGWADAVTLLFTSENWSAAQYVDVRAYADFSSEGERSAGLQHLVVSDDAAFDGMPVLNANVRIIDDDRAGVVVIPTGVDTLLSESGIEDAYTVAITRLPLTTVTVTLHAGSQACFVSGGDCLGTLELTFDPDTDGWDDVHTITLRAVDDTDVESFHFTYVTAEVDSGDVFGGEVVSVSGNRITITTDESFSTTELRGYRLRVTGGAAGGESWWIWGNAMSTPDGNGGFTTVVTIQGEIETAPATDDAVFVNGYTPPATIGVLTGVVSAIDLDETTVTVTGVVLPTANGGLSGATVRIFLDDGSTQFRTIASNTADTITFDSEWAIDPGTEFSIVDVVGLVPDTVFALIADNDTPTVIITQTDGSTRLSEGASGIVDSYTVVLGMDPGAETVRVTIRPLETETYHQLDGDAGLRNDVQLLVSSSAAGAIVNGDGSITLVFDHSSWSTAQTVNVTAIDDEVVDGSDLQAFADSAQRVYLVQGPLFFDGDIDEHADRTIPPPVLLPGESSTDFREPLDPSIDAIEDRQVDTLNVFNQDSVSDDEGTLTFDRLQGLGMGGDQFAGGRFLLGGIGYESLEAVNIHLGSGDDDFTILSTHTGTTVVHGNGGDDTFDIRTIDGHTNVRGDGGDDTFRIGSDVPTLGGVLDELDALLVIDGGDGVDVAIVDDSGDPDDDHNLGTLTQTTITGLDMISEAVDRLFSLTIGATTTTVRFEITVPGADDPYVLELEVGFTAAELETELQKLLFPVTQPTPENLFPDTGCGSEGATECAQSVFVWQHDGDYLIGFRGELHGIAVGLAVTPVDSPAGATATDLARMDGISYYGFDTDTDEDGDSDEHLTILLGEGHDRFNVRGTIPHTLVDGGPGDDLIYVSDSADLGLLPDHAPDRDLQSLHDVVLHGTVIVDDLTFVGSLDLIEGQLDIRAGGGSNTVSISDRDDDDADTAVVITDVSIAGLAPALITYGATGDLAGQGFWTTSEGDLGLFGRGINIYAGLADDDITITSVRGGALGTSTFGATVTSLFAGGGSDQVHVDVDGDSGDRRLVIHGNDGDETNDPVDLVDDDTIDAGASTMPVVIFGDAGDDTIIGGLANDQLFGDDGRVLYLKPAAIDGGFDVVFGGTPVGIADLPAQDSVFLTPDVLLTRTTSIGTGDTIDAGAGNDIVFGGRGSDTVHGDGGNDLVFGDFGRVEAAIEGGWVDASLLPLSMDLEDHPFRFFSIDRTNTADAAGDVLHGDAGDDILMGQQGADVIFGGAGDDDIWGGHNVAGGHDTGDSLDGGSGNDVVLGDNGIILRTGDDVTTLVRVLVDSALYGAITCSQVTGVCVEASAVTGAAQANPTDVEARAITLLDHAATTASDLYGSDLIAGGADDDVIFGQLGDDRIHGDGRLVCDETCDWATAEDTSTDGDDYVEGNGGGDTIRGGLGQDDLIGGSSDLFGLTTMAMRPDGIDTIFGGNGDAAGINDVTTGASLDADVLLGDNGRIFRVVGTNGTDTGSFLSFNHAPGVIARVTQHLDYSPIGDDGYWLVGPADSPSAPTWCTAGSGAPCVTTHIGTNIGGGDFLHGEAGNDIIHGQTGNDALFGDAGDDDLYGESGEDWISGGTGHDGILGDDGRIHTRRNSTTDGEPLYGLAPLSCVSGSPLCHLATPGDLQVADIYADGEIHKSVQLDLPTGEQFTTFYVGANDIAYGGLGNDFIHGGEGEDALSGAEALPLYYTDDPWQTLEDLGYDVDGEAGVLRWGERAGEFWYYDEYDPKRRIDVCSGDHGASSCLAEDVIPFLMVNDGTVDDGTDTIFGDGGNDWIVGGTNHDRMFGGWGDDLLDADDVPDTNGGANDAPDVATTVTYADIAYGGGGRDILIGNTGADRLIDWVGEFNSYVVPFSPFGAFAVSRMVSPALQEYLLDLAEAQGADITRCGTGLCPSRNGEPFGELGMVLQADEEWQDQTGAPADPQPGNSQGRRDVLRYETFQNTVQALSAFATVSGSWEVVNGRYESRAGLNQDAISIFYVDAALPPYYEVYATLSADKAKGGQKSNGYLLFDFQGATDFKFAGIDIGTSKAQIGRRTAAGWVVLAQANVTLVPNRAYSLLVVVDGQTVTLYIDGVLAVTYTFSTARSDPLDPESPFADPLNDGLVGVGSYSSIMRISDMGLAVLAPDITFSQTEEFDAAPAGYTFDAGTWTVSGGAISGDPAGAPAALAVTSLGVGAAASLVAETVVSTSAGAGLAFDYYAPDRFKYVSLDAGGRVVIGHRTTEGFFDDASFAVAAGGGPHSLRIVLDGATVTVYVDGTKAGSFTYVSLLNDGALALVAIGGPATFESLTLGTDDPDLVPAVPFVSVGDAQVVEGNSGTTAVEVTVVLSAPSDTEVSVAWSTADGTADSGDYVSASGTLTFAPGETSKTITVLVKGDEQQEPDEHLGVLLMSPVGLLLGDASGQIRILNDDVPANVSVTATDPTASETGDTATFVVSRDDDIDTTLAVRLSWSGVALWSIDYTATASGATLSADGRTLTFAPGQASATITVRPTVDSLAELDESVILSIVPSADYGLGTPSAATATIADAALLPTLSVSDTSIVEGRTDSWAYVTVTLSAPSTQTVTVEVRTYDGTAKAGSDYRPQVTVLTFAPGETTTLVPVRIFGDKTREANETFTIQLSAPVNAVLADPVGVITIIDDDGGR